jgi:hypothetical protein
LQTATTVRAKERRRDTSSRKTSFLTVGLSVAGVILLATKIYLVSELLVLWAFLAAVFLVASGLLLCVVLVQEGVRWSVRHVLEAKHATLLSPGSAKF